MGGDDLNDELLWTTEPVVATHHRNDNSDADDDSSRDDHGEDTASSPTKDPPNSGQHTGTSTTSGNKRKSSEAKEKNQKKQKHHQQSTPEQLLLQAGRDLVGKDCAQQAAFLTMALRHYTLMEQQQQRQPEEKVDHVAKMEILPSYLVGRNREEPLEESRGSLILERIRDAVSVQKMKKWKHVGSPCVVRSLVGVP